MAFVLILLFLKFAQTANQENISRSTLEKIVGGEIVTNRENFPYQVQEASLRYYDKHFCGGCIITSQHILTAAHCFFDWNKKPRLPEFWTVVVGDLNILIKTIDTVVRRVVAIIYHNKYNRHKNRYDIGVMKIEKEFAEWTPLIASIELATTAAYPGDMCTASGWGATRENGAVCAELRMIRVPITAHSTCIKVNGHKVEDGMFCAGYIQGGVDSCQGDSGGPLTCNGILYGVISWGDGCARPGKLGVYTDVVYYRDWIVNEGLTGGFDSSLYHKSNFVLLFCAVIYYYLQ